MSAGTKPEVSPAGPPPRRPLPMVVFFEGDPAGKRAAIEAHRFRRLAFEHLDSQAPEAERVVVVTEEWILKDNFAALRAPNVRIIALTDRRFSDPRLDGAVYSYLPANTPPELVERAVENAVDHIRLLASRRELNERLIGATREISELNQIGAALSAEHNTEKLLELILTKSRAITQSDAGSLYIVESAESLEETTAPVKDEVGKLVMKQQREPQKRLRFKLAQNDTVAVPFREVTMEISERSIAGYVAMTGQTVNIADAYRLPPNVPYSINRKFDEDSGYRTKSILAVPMRNQKDEIVGVVQLLNAKRDREAKLDSVAAVTAQVVPYSQRMQEIAASLASQAAVALENSQLYQAIQALFEGFVKASVIAIEARDPTTSGHSFRVANLTVGLAEAVDRLEHGSLAAIHFTRQEMKEIRYASLLHDFGKVGVREEVLVKAKKLYPWQLDLVKQRFHFVKRTLQHENSAQRVKHLLEKGRKEYMKQLPVFDKEMEERLAELDGYFKKVLESNEPTVLPTGSFEMLMDIAARKYLDFDGEERVLLSEDEVRLLSIRKGSLDDAERRQIESHVVHTYNFLQQIPWTKEIRNIPGIARGHHEKLNGTGYPYKLSAPEIPVQTRMMTISDIFDALAASDRPYKKAVSLERALDILDLSVKDGELDPDLHRVFVEARVFDKWKIEPFPY
ncbi:MAG TPA: HD domain-containing phosphohydrolase [Terriglobales bacterium]|nr:HD domain-containing phosphohydrolase [Terriglobales bacterium]